MTALAAGPTEMIIRPPQQDTDFMPVLSIQQAVSRYNAVLAFAKDVMKEGRDYGTIPGTEKKSMDGLPSNKNHTLLKPGAEKLCTLFGMVPDFEDYRVVEDWDKGLFYYAFRCNLMRNGRVVGSGIGSCNSREKKFTRLVRLCPECSKPAIKRSKYPPRDRPDDEPGWYCHDKSGGCGANFAADDSRIVGQALEADPSAAADNINTIQKQAQKRSLVAAVLVATNASELFTQDVEDMDFIDVRPHAPSEPRQDDIDQRPPAEIFNEKWHAAIEARGLPINNANSVLSATLLKAKKDIATAPESWLEGLLNAVAAGKFDAALKKEPVEESGGEPSSEPGPWERFKIELWELAEAQGCKREEFDAQLNLWLLRNKAKGKEDEIQATTKKACSDALATKTGMWSFLNR